MATMRSEGLHHAVSLGNIEASSQPNYNIAARNYDSEDENMGRNRSRQQTSNQYGTRPPIYSKEDIIDQYCLNDKQLNSIEPPRRDRFFGCWSNRGTQQSFLGVCVGRRAPSDENLQDYAPINRHPRIIQNKQIVSYDDDDLDSSYFRRKPRSFLSNTDAKRYTWMPADEDSVRLEAPRPICQTDSNGPYVVGSYPPKSSFLSQSSEQITGSYRCPAHNASGLPAPPPPPQNATANAPRTKHVSFARSLTLASFDEAMGMRPMNRMLNRSQERLIGGKKPTITISQQQPIATISGVPTLLQKVPQQQPILQQPLQQHQPLFQHQPQFTPQQFQLAQQNYYQHPQLSQQQSQQSQMSLQSNQEVVVIEKLKRGAMKTQATQTEVHLARKNVPPHHLSLSPRTIHRVKMVSQGAQTNGMNGKKLTKSYSEIGGCIEPNAQQSDGDEKISYDHNYLNRTHSEDSPKSPLDVATTASTSSSRLGFTYGIQTTAEIHSRTSSRQSQLETSRSDTMSTDNFFIDSYHSQDSGSQANTYRSVDMTMPSVSSQDTNVILSRRGSHTLQTEPIFIGRNELEKMQGRNSSVSTASTHYENGYPYQTNSLPRRCIHHKPEEYNTYSLPRREHHHHYVHEHEHDHTTDYRLSNGNIPEQIAIVDPTRRMPPYQPVSQPQDIPYRRPSHVIAPDSYSLSRRSSLHQQQQPPLQQQPMQRQMQYAQPQSIATAQPQLQQVPSEETCSTCESETDSKENEGSENGEEQEEEEDEEEEDEEEEKEIFIDFKPRISPTPSPSATKKKKKLIKTMSEGEILTEKKKDRQVVISGVSASEEDLKLNKEQYSDHLQYTDTPIRDEDIFNQETFLNVSPDSTSASRYTRETFRKRSVSLEDPLADNEIPLHKPVTKTTKTGVPTPDSPCPDELSIQHHSPFPSSDSLANDITKDHSDGIWNESQATVLTANSSLNENSSLLTPSTKRKHLLHQQRSSLDVEAIDIEDIADQPLPPLPPIAQLPLPIIQKQNNDNTTVSTTTQTMSSCLSTIKTATSTASTTTPTGVVKPTPSIAVTQTQSMEREEIEKSNIIKKNEKKKVAQKQVEMLRGIHKQPESTESSIKTSIESNLNRGDSGKNFDISEGSTTEDYITCTDNSKRNTNGSHTQGIRYPLTGTISTTQVPVGVTQSPQTVTLEGSSFDSVSSLHSLARVEAICEDVSQSDEKVSSTPIPKASPAHSVSSSSSDSYGVPASKTSPSRPTMPKALPQIKKGKVESVSDDDRSEKVHSSSHDEKDYKTIRSRRPRDWSEEERRRKKGNFKLEFDKEVKTTLISPNLRQTSPAVKKISPEDKTALNILDGASPTKTKRFRPKTRKTPRIRSAPGDEALSRRSKTPVTIKSPEKPLVSAMKPTTSTQQSTVPLASTSKAVTKLSPSKYQKPASPISSPKKQPKSISPIKRLKAISTESLRSVSPGSDSVFYSEADQLDQVHCHHCGKEVEVVAAMGGSEESVVIVDDGPDIVQPPEGFADSPNGVSKIPPALKYYKKYDKRYRSEDRRHHKKGSDCRAKSEERGKEDEKAAKIRAAGSTPCVVPVGPFEHGAEPDQGIYHGTYSRGEWICIADRDVWRRTEVSMEVRFADRGARDLNERRGSTDSEKDFRKKYQAITHRLVHRKSCVEMYKRQSSNSFDADKCVVVQRDSGEFGFRIHGSKPVVVSAIEPDTPAESSGLEVGDIVLAVNGISVVDKSHSEVVKIAHAGSDTLELEIARTRALSPMEPPVSHSLFSGFLWRKSEHSGNIKWVRRWFCLRPDQCLYFYKSESDIQPVGVILLTNLMINHMPGEKAGRAHAFCVQSAEQILLNLAAENEENANRWVVIMSHAAEQNDTWLDLSTRNLRLAANSILRPDCTGFLMKLGARWRAWAKRYCVLKDACLYFYHEPSNKVAIGMACLQGYRVQPSVTGGKKYAFELIPPEPKYRNYYFHTDSEMDKKRWVAALEYSIDRWMKAK